MGIILWIIFGAIAGWIASAIMYPNSSQGTMTDIVMGVVGAVVGGFLMGLVGQSGVTGFNVYSLVVAVIGAVVVIYVGRILRIAKLFSLDEELYSYDLIGGEFL